MTVELQMAHVVERLNDAGMRVTQEITNQETRAMQIGDDDGRRAILVLFPDSDWQKMSAGQEIKMLDARINHAVACIRCLPSGLVG